MSAAEMTVKQAEKFLAEAPGGVAYETNYEQAQRVIREAKQVESNRKKAEVLRQTIERQRVVVSQLHSARKAFDGLTAEEQSRVLHAACSTVDAFGFSAGLFGGLGRAIRAEEHRLAEQEEQATKF